MARRRMISLFLRVNAYLAFLLVAYVCVVSAIATFATGGEIRHLIRTYTNIPLGVARRGDSSMLRFREAARTGPVDVLFIGSSHCYRSFDPRFFAAHGLKAFNMGSLSQSPITSYHLLHEYLDRLAPRVVVYELYWGVMDQDGTESALDLLANRPFSWSMAEMVLRTRSVVAVNGMLATLLDWGYQPIQDVAPNLRPDDTYVSGGYVETSRPPLDPAGVKLTRYKIRFRDEQMIYLRRIAQELRRRGITMIIVTAPVSEPYWRSLENPDEWRRKINRFARENGATYIDFNSEARLRSANLFYDVDHLNSEGVRVFSPSLYSALQALPSFRRSIENTTRANPDGGAAQRPIP